MFKWMLGVALMSSMVTHAQTANELTLVKDGVPLATIVVPQSPGPAWFAAGELQYHVKLITGAELPIVKDGADVAGVRVEIGTTTAAEKAGLASTAFKRQEYAIQFDGDTLFLSGNDPALDAGQATAPLKLDSRPDWYTPMGSLYATYDLLERYMGVRWYAPTEAGMVYSPTQTLVVKAENLRRTPAIELRQNPGSGQPGTWGMVEREATSDEQALLMLRLKMGGYRLLIGHSFEGFPARFWEKDSAAPEGTFEESRHDFFAIKTNGMRDPGQMCFSSTGLLAQVVKDARAYFDGKGLKYRSDAGEGYYCVGPRDMETDLCKCADCVPKISKADWKFFSSGKSSELVWGFVNKVQEELKTTHPDAHITCFNYADYAYYPTSLVVDANVWGGPCLHSANWWAPAMEQNDMRVYKDWITKSPRGNMICLWMYQCFPWENGQTLGFKVFPSWHAHTIARQIPMFAEDGVRGVFVCGQVTHYIDGYLTIKLMDDPTLNVDEVLNEFFARYYGAAAESMKKLYLAMEETFMTVSNYPPEVVRGEITPHQSEEIAWKWLGTTERMANFGQLLDSAKAAADGELAKKRVAVFEQDIWTHMQEGKARWDVKTRYGAEVEALKNSPPPVLGTIPKVSDLAANGDPSKVDWSKALVTNVTRGVDGYPTPGRDVTISLLHDGVNCYMQIKEKVDFGSLQNAGYFGDRWEVFFAAKRAEPYRQFGLMPDGEVRYHAFGQEESWPACAKRTDTQQDGYWTMNISVPIEQMSKLPLKAGDTFYINFIRATSKGVAPLAYSPLFQGAFHCLPRLAEATFGE